jgi:hypothetical protein
MRKNYNFLEIPSVLILNLSRPEVSGSGLCVKYFFINYTQGMIIYLDTNPAELPSSIFSTSFNVTKL